MDEELLNKTYTWEDSVDLERDMSEMLQTLEEIYIGGEWEGQLKVVVTHIEED